MQIVWQSQSSMLRIKTVVFTTSERSLPEASKIFFMLVKTCLACSSIVSEIELSAGFTGICPEISFIRRIVFQIPHNENQI